MPKIENLHVVQQKIDDKPKTITWTNVLTKKETNVRKLYFNNNLIWQNSNIFIATPNLSDLDLSELEEDTIILVGFSPKYITGEYLKIEADESLDTVTGEQGQVVVKDTTEDEN